MNSSFVGKRRESRNVVREGYLYIHNLRYIILNIPQHGQLVLLLDVLRIDRIHTGGETSQRRDPVALADSQNRSVDVGHAGFQRREGVGYRTASIVVAVKFDIATHY